MSIRLIPKASHEDLQSRMKAIIELLEDDECPKALTEEFNGQEIHASCQKLEKMYQDYLEKVAALDEVISLYRMHQVKTTNVLREKYRQLNRKLENNTEERKKLGLPAEAPIRAKVTLNPEAQSRSRYYHSRKK